MCATSAIATSPRCVSSRARNSPALLAPAAAIFTAYLILLSGFKGTSQRLLDIEHTYYNLSQTNQKGSTMAARITGKVIVPAHIEVWPHEFKTAQALAAAGFTVEFLRRSEGAGVKSADIIMNGVAWEMKAPQNCKPKEDSEGAPTRFFSIAKCDNRLHSPRRSLGRCCRTRTTKAEASRKICQKDYPRHKNSNSN